MPTIKVIAGNFNPGGYDARYFMRRYLLGKIKKVEKLSDVQGYSPSRAFGFGLVGGLAGVLVGFLFAGLIGFAAGAVAGAVVGGLLGGRQSQVTFALELSNGKNLSAITDAETYAEIYSDKGKITAKSENEQEQGEIQPDADPQWFALIGVFVLTPLVVWLVLWLLNFGN